MRPVSDTWRRRLGAAGVAAATVSVCILLLAMPIGAPLRPAIALPTLGLLIGGVVAARFSGHAIRGLIPFVLLAAAGIASSELSPYASASRGRSATGIMLLAVFPAAQLVIRNEHARRAVFGCALLVIVVAASDILTQFLRGTSLLTGKAPAFDNGRFDGSLPNPNEAAFVVVLAPLAAGGLAAGGLEASRRARLLCTACATLAVVLLTGSRAMLAGIATAVTIAAGLVRPRWAVVAVAGCAAMAGLAWLLDIASIRDRVADTLAIGEESRLRVWRVAWNAFLERPLLGSGPSTFFEVHESARAAQHPAGWEPARGGMPWAHSIPLEVLCERGLVGFAIVATIVARTASDLRRARADARVRALASAVIASSGAFGAMALVDLSLMKDWCLVLVCLLSGFAAGLVHEES